MSTERSLQSLLQSTEPAVLDECMSTAAQTLGFANLKPEQHRAVVELVRGRDTFVSLPTGYGKSLIYRNLTYFVHFFPRAVNSSSEREETLLLSLCGTWAAAQTQHAVGK